MSRVIIKNELAELSAKLCECDNQTRSCEESYAKLVYVYPAYTTYKTYLITITGKLSTIW